MQHITSQSNELRVAGGISLSEWTKKFWEWLYQTPDEANPLTTVGPARPWRYRGRQPTEFQKECLDKYGESVWYIAPAPYSEPGGIIQIDIPIGDWWLLIAPATSLEATQIHPSLNTMDKLRRQIIHDTDAFYELWTILDGFSIPWYHVDNTDELITIENIPTSKHKNIIRQDLPDGIIHTIQLGYWNLVRPEYIGAHILTIHSRSPTYRVDITYQLEMPGPQSSSGIIY